ncbi:MFS transporter [Cognatishimia activa]|uniref:Cation transport protein n=1 Tax=Cognatishimia activa TaxID=1715691 RepID=A0A0P1IPE8_9RHOB|nr:MFS transporter [Cognatishimia activa]CUJ20427.1 cation transport protein [Cognatishimia activa]CUK25500.1 cation transport protein [Cognatishimia activa]
MPPKTTTRPLILILILWSAGLGAAMQFAKVTVSLDGLRTAYNGSDTVLGLMLSSISFLGVLLGLVAGLLVASYGFRRMLLWALFGGGALSAVQAFLPPIEIFMIGRLLEGMSHLGIVVAAPTLIALIAPESLRFLAMTLWSAFFAVGYALTTAVAPWIIASFGASGVFAAHGIFMAVVGVLVLRYLPSGTAERVPFPPFSAIIQRHWAAYRSPYQFAPGAVWLFYTCTFVSVITVVPPLLTEFERTVLVPLLPIAGIVSSFTIAAMLLRYLSAVRVLLIGLMSALFFSLSGFVLPLSGWMLLGLFASMGIIQSAAFAELPELNKTANDQALANGAMSQMGNMGNLVSTPIMFALFTAFGTWSIYGMLVVCFSAAITVHVILAGLRSKQSVLV